MESTTVENSDQQEFKTAGMSRNYFCIDCKCSTRNPRLYLEHRRDFHKEPISIHKCDLCVYASKHSQKLARHLRTVHRDLVQDVAIQSTSNANFAPSIDIMSDSLQSLQASKNTRLSTCKLCGLFTVSKTVLMDHIRTQHPDVRIYKCDQCDYSHYIRDRYNRHHRYHSMNHIRCKMCEFQTIYRWNLERHMRHHIDAISFGFRCNKCNFTASTKQSITAHEIAHHSGLHFENNSPDALQATEIPSTSTNEHPKQNIVNENEMDGENNFDASAFLEIVLDDNYQSKHETETSQFHGVTVKQEILSEHGDSNKTKYFYCINCNFRNEINSNVPGIEEPLNLSKDVKFGEHQTPNTRYRCGYCHQMSNWKHVIERHCRLVHNSPAFIEKYSVEEQLFQCYTPIKRRLDSCPGTADASKKKTQEAHSGDIASQIVKNEENLFNSPQNLI